MPIHTFSSRVWLSSLLAIGILSVLWFNVSAQSSSDPQLEEGAALYAQNCAVCHGPNGEGRAGATLAKDWPSIRPDLTVKTIIENGVPGSPMPAWSQVNGGPFSPQQIEALVYFILSWQTGGAELVTPAPTATTRPPISPLPEVQGNPNQGAVLYDQNCQMCHGPGGQGRIGVTLAQDWPGIRPDLSLKTSISNGVSGSPMPAWSQSNGGPLNDAEIDDLVSYILTLPASVSPPTPTPTPQPQPAWITGWGGMILFVVLLVVILVAAWLFQRRSAK